MGTTRSSRPSVEDVAALASVSLGTVSNVLNRPEKVAGPTRERVERAMASLGYVPNSAARSLASGATRNLGLIVSDLANSLFVDIARGAESGAEEHGLDLLIANSDLRVDREASQLAMFVEARVAGVLMTLNDADHYAAVASNAPRGTPLVVLNFSAPTSEFCSVDVDNEAGGFLAARHLIEAGRTKLTFVGGPPSLRPVADRGVGVRRAVAESPGVSLDVVEPAHINRSDGWEVGKQLAPRIAAGAVDGVVAASDLLAAGIVQALLGAPGIRVPEDVAVIGYDNNQAAWDSPIPISTIAQPGDEVGRLGAELAVEEARANGVEHEHRALVLPPRLVARRSSTAG